MYRKGLNLGGIYEGQEIQDLIAKIKQELEKEEKGIHRENTIGILTNTDPEGVVGKLVKSYYDDKMLKQIDNLLNHAKRAERIRKLLDV